MKLRIAIIAVLLALVLIPNQEAKSAYSNAISGDPIGLAWGWLHATFEFQTAPKNSFTIFANIGSWSWETAFGAGASYRWYLGFFKDGKNIIEGFSFGPRASIAFISYDTGWWYDKKSELQFAIGAEAAYKWVWGGFMVEPYVTVMFGSFYHNDYGGVNIGYAW